jgi:hypothetical protein
MINYAKIIKAFSERCLEPCPEGKRLAASALREALLIFCAALEIAPPTSTALGIQLRALGYERMQVKGLTYYRAVRLRNNERVGVGSSN